MDQDRTHQSFTGSGVPPASRARPVRFWLERGEERIELPPGVVLVGRSSSCHIVVDDPMVSRRHAQLRVGTELTIEDFESVNGVYINTRRIDGAEPLKDGDQIQIGTQQFIVRSAPLTDADGRERLNADTLENLAVPHTRAGSSAATETDTTFSAHMLDLLGGVADKVLAMGRGEEAEKLLATILRNVLHEIRTKGPGAANPDVVDKAAAYAVRLAEATGKGRWVDYAVELFSLLRRPLRVEVVDHLYEVSRKTSPINLQALRDYVERLRAIQHAFGPSDRFVLQRLEGLERIAALR